MTRLRRLWRFSQMLGTNKTTGISARGGHMLASHWLPLDVEPSCIPALWGDCSSAIDCMHAGPTWKSNKSDVCVRLGLPWKGNPCALAEPLSPEWLPSYPFSTGGCTWAHPIGLALELPTNLESQPELVGLSRPRPRTSHTFMLDSYHCFCLFFIWLIEAVFGPSLLFWINRLLGDVGCSPALLSMFCPSLKIIAVLVEDS
jgi:hypothetical protein